MARKARARSKAPQAIGYVRVSTDEQATSGLGIAAQRSAIEDECRRRGIPLGRVFDDQGLSAKDLKRPALQDALELLETGAANLLIVSKLDRLTRSVHDATGLMQRAEKSGWGLVALDVAVDTTTPQGAAMAQVLAVFAELERKMIGQRTRDALAIKRAEGVRLGRPRQLPEDVVDRIVRERDAGSSWPAIARALNADAIPTAHGGRQWHPATVRLVYLTHQPDRAA
jgi:DNA invertase Pin-like site-specific DNA recombinase